MAKRLIKHTLNAARRGTMSRNESVTVHEGSDADKRMRKDPAFSWTVVATPPPRVAVKADDRAAQCFGSLCSRLEAQGKQVAALDDRQYVLFRAMIGGNKERVEPLALAALSVDRIDALVAAEGGLENLGFTPEEIVAMDLPAYTAGLDDTDTDTDDDDDDDTGAPIKKEGGGDLDNDDTPPPAADPTAADLEAAAAAKAAEDAAFKAKWEAHRQAGVDLLACLAGVVDGSDKRTTIGDMGELATAAGVPLPDPLPRTRAAMADTLYELATTAAPDAADLGD